jgi:hypothetical protein
MTDQSTRRRFFASARRLEAAEKRGIISFTAIYHFHSQARRW